MRNPDNTYEQEDVSGFLRSSHPVNVVNGPPAYRVSSTIETTTQPSELDQMAGSNELGPLPSNSTTQSIAQASFFDSVKSSLNVEVGILLGISCFVSLILGLLIGWMVRGNRTRSRHNSDRSFKKPDSDASTDTQVTTLGDDDTLGSRRNRHNSVKDYSEQCLTKEVDYATIERIQRKNFEASNKQNTIQHKQRPNQLTLTSDEQEREKFLTINTVTPYPTSEPKRFDYSTLQVQSSQQQQYASLTRPTKPKYASVGQYPGSPVSPPKVPSLPTF